jgi:hypothetical protein
MIRHAIAFLAVVLPGLPVSGQQTWWVNCNGGPGVDFTDLPPAVAAASPGDTILVYSDYTQQPWCQSSYTAPVIDKGVRIEGFTIFAPPPPTTQTTYPSYAPVSGLLTVSDVPVGEQVVLSNLRFWYPAVLGTPSGCSISDCDGRVLIEGCHLESKVL